MGAGSPLESPGQGRHPFYFTVASPPSGARSSYLRKRLPISAIEQSAHQLGLSTTGCTDGPSGLSHCSFDEALGTGLCGTTDLAKIRSKLNAGVCTSGIIRDAA